MARQDTIGKTATSIFTDGDYTCVKYHNTIVIKWNNDHIILNSGGYRTNTTKLRINQASNQFKLGIRLIQENFEWIVIYNSIGIGFYDGMIIKRN